jgi:hypothetical protein
MRWLAACVLLMSTVASAQLRTPERVRFVWQRGPGTETCPGQAELGRRIAARLGRDPFVDDAERSVEARVERVGEDWRVEVRVVDREGRPIASREPLESTAADCAALADAVVLSVALAIDPELALGAPQPAAARAPTPAPIARATCPSVPCPERTCAPCPAPKPVSPSTRVRASLRALAALGVLPAPAPGVSLAAEIEPNWGVSFGLAMLYLPEMTTDDGALALGLTAVELFGCPVLLGAEGASLQACLGFQTGSLHAVAKELRPVDPGDYLWLSPTLGPRGTVELGRHAHFELGAAAAVPLIAHDFTIGGRPDSAYRPARIGFLGWAGVGWQSP